MSISSMKTRLKWLQKNPGVVIATFALIVSAFSLIVSAFSVYSANRSSAVSRRPYVFVVTRSSEKDGKQTVDLKWIRINCFNNPAKLIGGECSYLVVETNKNDGDVIIETAYNTKFAQGVIVSPSGNQSMNVFMPYDVKKKVSGLNPELKLRRIVSIAYKELAGGREYFYEGS